MPGRRANPSRIKLNRTYTASELALRLDVHKNTIRNWQRDGLETIDETRPALFRGEAVRSYLMRKASRRKHPCPPGTFYCFGCRAPRRPALGMVDYLESRPGKGNLRALCDTCETVMYRHARRDALSTVMPGIEVQILDAPSRLTETMHSSISCDLKGGSA